MKRKYHCLSNSSNNNNKYLREKRIDILYIRTIIYCEKSLFSNENHAHISLKRKKKEREKIIHICTNKLCTAINNRNSFHLKDYYFSSKDREDCLKKNLSLPSRWEKDIRVFCYEPNFLKFSSSYVIDCDVCSHTVETNINNVVSLIIIFLI